jgi:predicted kinase
MAEKPRLYVLTGLPFAGKTTLGKAIAKSKKIPIVDLSDIICEKGLSGKDIAGSQFAQMDEEAGRRASGYLQKSTDVVYDITPFTKTRRDRIRSLANENEARFILIFVDIPREETLRRYRKQNNRKHLAHENNVMYVTAHFEAPTEEEHIVFHAGENIHEWVKSNVKDA